VLFEKAKMDVVGMLLNSYPESCFFVNSDGVVKTIFCQTSVIPAQAGIQEMLK